jgi:hypothetical protein
MICLEIFYPYMKLYDIFFQTLENTDNIDKAIQAVEQKILKRKTFLSIIVTDKYDALKTKLDKMMKLKRKLELLKLTNLN